MTKKNTGKDIVGTVKATKKNGKAKKYSGPLTREGEKPVHQRTIGIGNIADGEGTPFTGSALPKKGTRPVKKFKGLDADNCSAVRAANGQVRIRWNGHSIASLIRFMGYHGANAEEAGNWAAALGYPGLNTGMLRCQTQSGRRGAEDEENQPYGKGGFHGPFPELSKEETAYLKSIRPASK